MAAAVTEKNIAPQLVISIARHNQPLTQVGALLASSVISLMVYLKELGISIAGTGFTIYHKHGETVDFEVCLPVDKSGQDRGDIKFKEAKGGVAASTSISGNVFLSFDAILNIVSGGYDKLQPTHEMMKKYCADNGKAYTEIREVFHKGPTQTKNSDEYQTELLYL